jgi:hypothetical protein
VRGAGVVLTHPLGALTYCINTTFSEALSKFLGWIAELHADLIESADDWAELSPPLEREIPGEG